MTFRLLAWGNYACFSRPELKAERVSYDVITPSAARAILEAIFWKPAFRWEISAIDVINPVRWANVRRNELGSVAPYGTIRSAMSAGQGDLGIFIEEDRQQRAATILRDVRYRIHARQILTRKAGADDPPQKLAEMFRRRAAKGQCVMQPYLGCREFAAFFALEDDSKASAEPPLAHSEDFGWMLHDLDFKADPPRPGFFHARMQHGRIDVPPVGSKEIAR